MKNLSWESKGNGSWSAEVVINDYPFIEFRVFCNMDGLFSGRLYFMSKRHEIMPQKNIDDAKAALAERGALCLQKLAKEIEENLKMLTTLSNSENDDPVMLCVKEGQE